MTYNVFGGTLNLAQLCPLASYLDTLITAPQRHLANGGKPLSICNAFQWPGNPPKLPLPLERPRTPSNYLGPPHPTRQTASRSVQPFLQDTSTFRPHIQAHTDTPRHTSVATGRIYMLCIYDVA